MQSKEDFFERVFFSPQQAVEFIEDAAKSTRGSIEGVCFVNCQLLTSMKVLKCTVAGRISSASSSECFHCVYNPVTDFYSESLVYLR